LGECLAAGSQGTWLLVFVTTNLLRPDSICYYRNAMDVEFDPAKDAANRRQLGISWADSAGMDFDTAIYAPDYGEERIQALGSIGGRLHMLAFTMRGNVLRAISLRKANPREVKRHDKKT
jgi:uncharacterized DUF497 family protein